LTELVCANTVETLRLEIAMAFASALCVAVPAYADAPDADMTPRPATAKRAKKKVRRGPVFQGRLASTHEIRDTPLGRPSGHIALYAVNFREELDVDLYGENGEIDPDAVDQLNHLWRCKRTDTEKAIDPRLYELLSHIYDHFGRRMELVSGFRNQKRTSSFHFHGSASDIRIPGVSEKQLYAFAQTLDTGGMGIGIYPKAGFIHIDIRPEPSYRWTDYSPPGSGDMGRPKAGPKKKPKNV
jgi:uncharacterized protein YcbK (DUF882 family)